MSHLRDMSARADIRAVTCAVLFYCYHPKGNTARLRAIIREKYGESVVTVIPPSERARGYVN